MKTKICKNCYYFKKIYRKYIYQFGYSLSYPMFYCTLREQLTERGNACENIKKKKGEYDISLRRFDEAEEDIKKMIDLLRNIEE